MLTSKQFTDIISSSFLGLVLTLLDVLSYGRNIYGENSGNELENMSIAIYIYTTIIAQVCFNIFTSIKSGVMAGFICENAPLVASLFALCKTKSADNEAAHSNFIFCRIVIAILYAVLSFILNAFKVEYIIQNIPVPAVIGCLTTIGVSQVRVGYGEVSYAEYNSITFIVISLLLAISLYLITEKLLTNNFALPLSCLAFTGIFYVISFVIHRKDVIVFLRGNNWIGAFDSTRIYPTQLYRYFDHTKISMDVILSAIPKIFSIASFSMIHIAINLPSFFARTKVPYDFSSELRTQGYSNLITSGVGGNAYFIASYSVLFSKNGGTKLAGIIMGFLFLIIPMFGSILKGYIPRVVLSALPTLMGLYFLVPIFFYYFECTIIEYLIIFVTFLCSFFSDLPIVGLAAGTICCVILHFIHNRKRPVSSSMSDIDATIIKFDGALTFLNLNKLENGIKNNKKRVILIDLEHCSYIDWNARNKILSLINSADSNVILVGRPSSFINYDDIKDKRLYKAKDHAEAIKYYGSLNI